MEVRREMFWVAVILGVALSAFAAAAAVALDSLGVAQQPVLILAVITVGFVASWVQTGRVERAQGQGLRRHDVAVIPVQS